MRLLFPKLTLPHSRSNILRICNSLSRSQALAVRGDDCGGNKSTWDHRTHEVGQSADCADVEKNRGQNGSAPETMSKRIARLAALSSRPSSSSINRYVSVYLYINKTHGSVRAYGRETLLQPSGNRSTTDTIVTYFRQLRTATNFCAIKTTLYSKFRVYIYSI